MQGRERVVGDLRARGAHLRDERRLARARHAHERRVGHELHLELDPALLSRLAELRERGRAARRGDEMDVAAAARAPLGHDDALAVVREVGDELARLPRILEVLAHHGAHRHLEHEVLPRRAVHAAAFAVRAALGFEMVLEAVLDERGQARVGFEHHVAAVPAVAAVRPALRHMGLAAKRHATRAAVAALHMDAHFVDEHLGPPLSWNRPSHRKALLRRTREVSKSSSRPVSRHDAGCATRSFDCIRNMPPERQRACKNKQGVVDAKEAVLTPRDAREPCASRRA